MSKYRELLERVEAAHDWEIGQAWSRGGTSLDRTDTCRICGLSRQWESDEQNGIRERYTFTDFAGEEIPLRDAADLECCDDEPRRVVIDVVGGVASVASCPDGVDVVIHDHDNE